MKVIASNIFYDVIYFFRNQIYKILLLIIISTCINVVINYILSPNNEKAFHIIKEKFYLSSKESNNIQNFLKNISYEQKKIIMQASFISAIANLLGNLFLLSSMINMIDMISKYNNINITKLIRSTIYVMPKLFFLIFNITILVQLGFLFIIIPGIIIITIFSISPILMIKEKLDITKSMFISAKIIFDKFKLIVPAVVLWFILKLLFYLFISKIKFLSYLLTLITFITFNNIISAILIIYLYRFYMFIKLEEYL